VRLGLAALIVVGAITCRSGPRDLGSFTIQAVPPSLTAGTADATIDSGGDLVLTVSVRGPAREISRTGQTGRLEPNLLWHIVDGTCAAWSRGESDHEVRAVCTIEPNAVDLNEFTYVVAKSAIGDLRLPHALAAFRNGGGGPLYACGDLPPAA
jgi:hypothetical protein